jgi:hypothetical protein
MLTTTTRRSLLAVAIPAAALIPAAAAGQDSPAAPPQQPPRPQQLERTPAVRHTCRTNRCRHRVTRRVVHRHRRRAIAPYRMWLRSTRLCESGGDYQAVDQSGTHTGAYQFDDQTWHTVGGKRRAMHAGKLEQDYRAVKLRKARGTAPWPICG